MPTTLDLQFDGANNSTAIVDGAGHTFDVSASARLSTARAYSGTASLILEADSETEGISLVHGAAIGKWGLGLEDYTLAFQWWPESFPASGEAIGLFTISSPVNGEISPLMLTAQFDDVSGTKFVLVLTMYEYPSEEVFVYPSSPVTLSFAGWNAIEVSRVSGVTTLKANGVTVATVTDVFSIPNDLDGSVTIGNFNTIEFRSTVAVGNIDALTLVSQESRLIPPPVPLLVSYSIPDVVPGTGTVVTLAGVEYVPASGAMAVASSVAPAQAAVPWEPHAISSVAQCLVAVQALIGFSANSTVIFGKAKALAQKAYSIVAHAIAGKQVTTRLAQAGYSPVARSLFVSKARAVIGQAYAFAMGVVAPVRKLAVQAQRLITPGGVGASALQTTYGMFYTPTGGAVVVSCIVSLGSASISFVSGAMLAGAPQEALPDQGSSTTVRSSLSDSSITVRDA